MHHSGQNIWHRAISFIQHKLCSLHFRATGIFSWSNELFLMSLGPFLWRSFQSCRFSPWRNTAPPEFLPPIISHISTLLKLFVQAPVFRSFLLKFSQLSLEKCESFQKSTLKNLANAALEAMVISNNLILLYNHYNIMSKRIFSVCINNMSSHFTKEHVCALFHSIQLNVYDVTFKSSIVGTTAPE